MTETTLNLISTERVVELASTLCALRTSDSELAIAEYIADTLAHNRDIDVHIEDVVAGRPNVIATVKGGDRAPLVLNGHTDASIPSTGWERDPSEPWISGGRLFGGGVSDMLGAVAAMVAAVEAAPEVPHGLPGDLILHAVMHHDTIGLGAKYALAAEGPREGFGICGEPSSLAIHTANGGAMKFEVVIEGTTAHISRREDGVDALAMAVEVYQRLNEATFDHEPCNQLPDLPRLLVGMMEAGVAPAAVADRAVLRGDLRTVPGMERSSVRRSIESLVESLAGEGISHRVRLTAVQRPFLGATSGPLVDAISAAHATHRGQRPKITNDLPGQAFVTDAADMAAAGLETVVYGVGDWRYAPNESVAIDELVDSARVYLDVAANLDSSRDPS